MYYELLQQRYGVGINKQADIRTRAAQLFNKGVQSVGRIGGKASTMATARTAKNLKTGTAAVREQLNSIAKGPRPLDKNSQKLLDNFTRRRDAIAYKLGKKRLIGAGALGGTGLAGYGAHSMFGGDDASAASTASDTATSNQVQTPTMSDAQLMAQNGWNGWNWDDLGGSLANYITSGKIAEHAIPAILAYIAGRAMS